MSDYAISNVPRRVVYAASGTGPYAFTFEIQAAGDIAVYKGDTLLTLTTDYSVTINTNGTGSVTLTTSAGTSNITIVGSKTIQRITDFTTGGDFFANTLNNELDAQTIYIQQVAETAERGLKAPVTDPTDINMTLPRKTDRANKYLAFDASGNPVAGDTSVDVAAVAAISADIQTVSDNIVAIQNANSNATSASASASSASSSASAASASASTATTKASEASSSATAAQTAQTAAELALDSFDDRYLGAKTTNPTVDNDGNALLTGALYFNSVAMTMRVWNGSSWQDQAASPDTMTERSFLATAGQTTYAFTGGYRIGYTYVYVNGSMLYTSDVTLTDGANVGFVNALNLNDEVRILSIKAVGTVAIADISGLQTALDAKQPLDSELTTLAGMSASRATMLAGNSGFSFINRIINGDMRIDQRNAGASVTPTASTVVYTVDRFYGYQSQASKFSVQQNAGSITPPVGFINYLGATSLSAYSIISTDQFLIGQRIEGLNATDLAWGTANAKTVTLSFQVYSSLTGTFGGAINNSAFNRSYPFSFSIPVANTWTTISVTIAGDITGTWLTTNGIFASIVFSLGSGATYSTTANAWAAGNYTAPTGATSVVGTSGATFYITGVDFRAGSFASAPTWEFRSYQQEELLCKWYFCSSFPKGTAPADNQGSGVNSCLSSYTSSNGWSSWISFPSIMRSAPTITGYRASGIGATAGYWGWYSGGWISFISQAYSINTTGFNVQGNSSAGYGTSGASYIIGGHYTASAEL